MLYEEFKSKFNITLNAQQEVAVKQINGPTLLLAVPGSGKTTVIVTRLAYMLYCCNINPNKILTMTYTKAATKDMRNRFIKNFGDDYIDDIEFQTINAVCAKIINYYKNTKQRPVFKLLSNNADVLKILKILYIKTTNAYPTENSLKDIRTQITYCKNMQFSDAETRDIELEGIDFYTIYDEYKRHLIEHRLMDFDDQMVYALIMLESYPDILQHFQDLYEYLNVDEAQDTSKIQHSIIRLIASKNQNLFMVGDEDQSIYGFRAAYPQALLEFDHVYAQSKVLLMETNYRSTETIVNAADSFIQMNQGRHEKHMRTDNEEGEKIKHTILLDCRKQSEYIVELAKNISSETAVLYRINDSAIPIIDLLDKHDIPYRCRQVDALLFTHPIVQDVLNILKFALNPKNEEIFLNIYYKLNCGLKKTVVTNTLKDNNCSKPVLKVLLDSNNVEPWIKQKLQDFQRQIAKIPSESCQLALHRIVNITGYSNYLAANNSDMSKINILYAIASANSDINAFIRRLDELKEIIIRGGSKKSGNFILSTIHSSKGLEYDNVIIIDAIDGQFPNKDLAQLEEERRLFYVAVTRAKKNIELISYRFEYGKLVDKPFSFINQLLEPPLTNSKNNTTITEIKLEHDPFGKRTLNIQDISILAKDYIPKVRISHRKFGKGTILNKTDYIVNIKFDDGIEKKLDLALCLKNQLIELCG